MKLNYIPLFGGIIDSIITYFNVTIKILRERTLFIKNLKQLDKTDLRLSMNYFEIGIALGLVYLVPFFVMHEQSASKFIFVLQRITEIFIYTLCLYGSLRLLKVSKATFSKTITIMGFLWGLLYVFNFVLMTPILIAIGPESVLSGVNASYIGRDTMRTFLIVGTIGGFVLIIFWLYLILPWLSIAFSITKKRTFTALLIAGLPSGLINGFLLGPIFYDIEKALGNWLVPL